MRLPTRVLPILLAACAVLLPSGTAHAEQFLGITPDDRLVHFTAMDHTLRAPVKLTGLAGIGRVVAVDVRPATGGLYGIAQSGSIIRLVRIDQASGAVTPIGAPADILSTPIGLGLDFNPTTDQISFVSDNQRSLGFLPDTGAPIFKSAPSPIAWFDDVAWTPASGGYAAPFALDSGLDRLVLGDGAGSYVPDPSYLGVQIGGHATIDFSSGGTLWLLVHNALYTVDTSTGVAAGVGAMADPVDSMAVQLTGEAGFGAAAFGATESDGSATVTLRRAAPADSVAKVNWSTGGGTATAGVDYTAASGEVTFASGQSAATVTIPLANDGAAEGPERIGLHLQRVDGVPAGPDAAVVIADDDGGPAGGGGGDTTAPVLLALPVKLAAKRTVRLPFGASEAASATVTLQLAAKAAKKLHLPATLATAPLQARPGDNAAVLQLSRKAARKLHARRATKASAAIVATDAAGNRAMRTMKVTLT